MRKFCCHVATVLTAVSCSDDKLYPFCDVLSCGMPVSRRFELSYSKSEDTSSR